MADEQNLQQRRDTMEGDAIAPAAKKRTSSASRKTDTGRSQSKKVAAAAKTGKPRRYSDTERAEKLAQIEARTSRGEALKAAIKAAEISEQTFYKWKRGSAPVETPQPGKSASFETLADLVALEDENKKLRTQLAEKLRAENAELRKRLGMD